MDSHGNFINYSNWADDDSKNPLFKNNQIWNPNIKQYENKPWYHYKQYWKTFAAIYSEFNHINIQSKFTFQFNITKARWKKYKGSDTGQVICQQELKGTLLSEFKLNKFSFSSAKRLFS